MNSSTVITLNGVVAIITAIAVLVTAIASCIAAYKGVQNGGKITSVQTSQAATHELVNGQSAALLALTAQSSHAEGMLQGQQTADPSVKPLPGI